MVCRTRNQLQTIGNQNNNGIFKQTSQYVRISQRELLGDLSDLPHFPTNTYFLLTVQNLVSFRSVNIKNSNKYQVKKTPKYD